MKENLWANHPVLSAFVLAGSCATLLVTGFLLFDGGAADPHQQFKLALRAVLAALAWIVGCGIASRTRHDSWTKGLLCGLFFIPGLLVLLKITGGKNRLEVWQEANPELVGKQFRRQYRDVKALY